MGEFYEKHLAAKLRTTPDIGATAFGDAESQAVVAYRTLWNSYITSGVTALRTTATALYDVAKDPPSGFTAVELSSLADSYSTEADAYAKAWNQFAGTPQEQMGGVAPVALKDFQDTVGKMQTLVATDSFKKWVSGIPPTEPSDAEKARVQKLIDDSGVASKGVVELTIDEKLWELKNTIANAVPWRYLVIGGVVVGVILLIPVVTPVLLPLAIASRR